jgi:hypothetical protein
MKYSILIIFTYAEIPVPKCRVYFEKIKILHGAWFPGMDFVQKGWGGIVLSGINIYMNSFTPLP